jgi:glycosyltransferase involved in cell wall biosynthesis
MTQFRLGDIAVVVPAYNPDENLLVAIESLSLAGFADFVLIDDGSDAKSKTFISAASKLPGVTLLTHERNRGKGAALKSAYESILSRDSKPIGAIAVDSDGQHRSEDVVRVAEKLLSRKFRNRPQYSALETLAHRRFLGKANSAIQYLLGLWGFCSASGLRTRKPD